MSQYFEDIVCGAMEKFAPGVPLMSVQRVAEQVEHELRHNAERRAISAFVTESQGLRRLFEDDPEFHAGLTSLIHVVVNGVFGGHLLTRAQQEERYNIVVDLMNQFPLQADIRSSLELPSYKEHVEEFKGFGPGTMDEHLRKGHNVRVDSRYPRARAARHEQLHRRGSTDPGHEAPR